MAGALLRIFGFYVLVEVAAVAALVWAFGVGWTVLGLLGAFLAGLVLASAQIKRQIRRLRTPTAPGVLTDGGLVTAGTVLVLVPGPVSTLAGLLLLAPATRTAARPLLAAVATAALGRHTPLVAAAAVGRRWYSTRRTAGGRPDYIDAEFLDVTDVADITPRPLSAG